MKLIIAIIRETQLEKVRQALLEAEIGRITVSRVAGHGKLVDPEIYRGKKIVPGLVAKMKLEIAVNDAFVDITVNTIIETVKASSPNGSTGNKGDGKIFILPIEECIRISTGERGGAGI